ncbi:TIGR01777 family oxidoreductase [Vibrio mangrovi]|uniref:Epimerase family protein n=1 Tax=Vibrio mangrovi TaxID=474394 RepID=A0A1Y6IQ60_9VIBR|nr:TIGR01777 family oxidoreductase [Vibrio mangrovi]MDW6003430.1 TIGR01777 family oxidoreductase [Vibrio mangrovi]SMR99779.1 Epimerase family protein [Vibrio mangrovi]
MKILITGGSGLIGSELIKQLVSHEIVVLTRSEKQTRAKLNHLSHYPLEFITSLEHFHDLNSFDAVINLAGEPIADRRWTNSQKQTICQSRWQLTEKIVDLIHASSSPPAVLISGSAVGFYGDQQSHPIDENLHVQSHEFSHYVCATWESIARKAESEDTRVCLLRTGVVLSPDGGALKKMLPPYQLGFGGPIGQGNQYLPWIHIHDMVQGIIFLLETPYAHGPFNLCAPHPVQNRIFSKMLSRTLHRPHFMLMPAWAIRLIMGESAALVLDSIRAKPKKLTELGFEFQYSHLEPALKQILQALP